MHFGEPPLDLGWQDFINRLRHLHRVYARWELLFMDAAGWAVAGLGGDKTGALARVRAQLAKVAYEEELIVRAG